MWIASSAMMHLAVFSAAIENILSGINGPSASRGFTGLPAAMGLTIGTRLDYSAGPPYHFSSTVLAKEGINHALSGFSNLQATPRLIQALPPLPASMY
ncbi:hypothetical protein FNU76_17600 [Chitinimonas arctica]|uniref:Uncharacterized protein n=1 Tax=Chitinimonas arctica TaxID=2594795 RepID=A0A516SIP7_9NEIS|nr:hypothetical protein [Chitinimonas arctica]QDQ28013.1 hypothetical protein FNU76_17600 [Chitinimonas arctica]